MKLNMANWDRIARLIVAVVFLVLFFTNVVSGALGIILVILGVVFLVTGVIGFCPLYTLLKVSTKK